MAIRRARQKAQVIEKLSASKFYVQLPGSGRPTRINVHRYWRNELEALAAAFPAEFVALPVSDVALPVSDAAAGEAAAG